LENLTKKKCFFLDIGDVDEWGATSDVPDDEIIDNDGGGIEIYPNPTDDLASVFVDYHEASFCPLLFRDATHLVCLD